MICGTAGRVLLSAPHEVAQRRDGQRKRAEQGTADLARVVARSVNGAAIATCGEQEGDPNWDLGHPYRSAAARLAQSGVVLDLHLMRPRGIEVCLGLGAHPSAARPVSEVLVEELISAEVRFAVNWPFGARGRTITAALQEEGVPAVQLEINHEVLSDGTDRAVLISTLLRACTRLSQLG